MALLDALKREGFIRGFSAEELRPGVAQPDTVLCSTCHNMHFLICSAFNKPVTVA